MAVGAFTFDRLAYFDRLREAGFDEKQARAHAEALDSALRDGVATRADIETVRADIERLDTKLSADMARIETKLEARIETSAATLKVEILRWLIVTQIALAGFLFAAMKLVK